MSTEFLPCLPCDGERFVRVSVSWLCRVIAAGSGKCGLAAALVLAHAAGLRRGKRPIKVGRSLLREFGLGRHAYYRGLAALEAAGLVAVTRKAGARSVVRLVPLESQDLRQESVD